MKLNWTGKITEYFVENGKLTLILLISLFLWGIYSFVQTPKQYNPTIVAPAFSIKISYPGATRQEALEQVTKPLENILKDIAGVEDIYSVTMHGAFVQVNVNFYIGEDFNRAKVLLSDRIKTDMKFAPVGILEPLIESIDSEEVPVMTIALTSDKQDPIELRKFGFKLREKLSQVDGASRIAVIGGRKKELAIEIDQKKMMEYAIGIDQIEDALKRNNMFLPSGLIKGQGEYLRIETDGRIKNIQEAMEVVVVSTHNVNIRLKQVASVEEKEEEIESYVRHLYRDDQNNIIEHDNPVLLSISKLKGVNISDVTETIKQKMELLKKGFIPENVTVHYVVDDGLTARAEITGLMSNLFSAVVIVVGVLFFFLSFKASILVAISIPLTLATVFGVGYLYDQNINRITLFALILSLGLLVDNATVVIENIVRKLKGRPDCNRNQVIIESVNEVGLGLFMSTVTTVLAFIPMLYVTGMMGPYMGPIPFFVPTALVLSLIISLSINPWLASVFFKDSKTGEAAEKPSKLILLYQKMLNWLLESSTNRKRTLLIILVLLLLTSLLPVVELVKFRMLPKADVEQFFIYVDLVTGAPVETTREIVLEIEKKVLENKYVTSVQSYIGTPPITDFNGLFRNVSNRQNFNQATMRVNLIDDDQRSDKSEKIVFDLRRELKNYIDKKFGTDKVNIKLVEDPPGPPVLSTFLVRIQSDDVELMEKIARQIYGDLVMIDQLVDTDISLEESTKTLRVSIDRNQASQSRIAPAQIVSTLNALYSGKMIGNYHQSDSLEQEFIHIRFKRECRLDPEIINKIFLTNDLRISVPLSQLVTVEAYESVNPLMRENKHNSVYLYGDMGDRSVTYAAIDFLKYLFKYNQFDLKREKLSLFGMDFQSSEGKTVKINFGGEWELTLEVFRDLILAMLVAMFMIYFVLVAQFRSFSHPIIIMSTIPLCVIGVFPGFMFLYFINNEYFTATSMIGVIALAGIAVNNSIILLEYVHILRDQKMDLKSALTEASLTRLRPIMLTTLTTILGSLTIVNDPVWAGLAYSIIFGLLMSSSLILIVFPVLYYMLNEKKWRL